MNTEYDNKTSISAWGISIVLVIFVAAWFIFPKSDKSLAKRGELFVFSKAVSSSPYFLHPEIGVKDSLFTRRSGEGVVNLNASSEMSALNNQINQIKAIGTAYLFYKTPELDNLIIKVNGDHLISIDRKKIGEYYRTNFSALTEETWNGFLSLHNNGKAIQEFVHKFNTQK